MINCKICKREFKAITPGHLKNHSINLREYIKVYGESKTQTNTGKTHFKKSHVPWNKGKEHSDETREKISKILQGRKVWNSGKNLSEKHKEKLSMAHKGKRMSDETKKKISETLTGKPLTEERKKKISQSLKGRKLSTEWLKRTSKTWFKKNSLPWNKGKKHSDETKRKISESVKGGKWVNDEYRNKMRGITQKKWETEDFREKFLNGMKKSTKVSPNKLELEMIEIMKSNSFPFHFVGNGKFWINGGKTSYNPDFIHADKTQRKIIEIFGNYWHNQEGHKKRDEERIRIYKEKGFDVLVVWEKQIKNSKDGIIQEINNFLENGIQK